jgi:filamentous hemagglutinin family protein
MSVVLCGNGFSRGATAAMLLTVPGYVAAQLAVDPSSAGTSITESINKVPVINITNPGSDGLSHNRFTEFNVHKPGLIFNNSKEDGISQIGGGLMKNPGLTQHATAILSEVTGNNPSYLEGTMEVFGQRADIIIAKRTMSRPKVLPILKVVSMRQAGVCAISRHFPRTNLKRISSPSARTQKPISRR